MQIGMVGLGRMGGNMTRWLLKKGHACEGRWTIQSAIEEGVPVHLLSAALFDRFSSRGRADFANQVRAAMRFGLGGHVEKPSGH